jgi:CDP-glycerol glycerophosphotransferase
VGAPFRLLPVKNNRIVFENFFGKGYADSPRAIAEALIKEKGEAVECIWFVKGRFFPDIPREITQVKRGTMRELYYLATAHVWVDNSRKHRGVKKRKGQFYIQTMHGGVGPKKIDKDAELLLRKSYVKNAKADSKMIDALLVSSEWMKETFRRCLWYEGRMLETGLPRTDIFFRKNQEYADSVRTSLHIEKESRIVLYAPTFRENHDLSVYDIDYEALCDCLERQWGGKWVVIVRLHPNIQNLQQKISYTDKVLNGSAYDDISHQIIACDLLISDYSSCMFDAVYAGKRVILYAKDIQEYVDDDKLYFSLEEIPFPVCTTTDELCDAIAGYDDERETEKKNAFMKKIGTYEKGNAAVTVASYISRIMKI